MPKKITESQKIGERGETAAKLKFLELDFQFDTRSRLEAGIDGIAEIMIDGRPLAQMIAVQVKTTEVGRYSNETEGGFTYLVKPDDLEYWKGSNLPVIVLLHRIEDQSFYWKPIRFDRGDESRKLVFDKQADQLDENAKEKLTALCVEKLGQGYFVPPMRGGETAVINMIPLTLPEEMFVSASPCSKKQALAIILDDRPSARFDWVLFGGSLWSFHDPRKTATSAIVHEDQVEGIETEYLAHHDEDDHRNQFAFLLRKDLEHRFDGRLRWHRDKKLFYIPAKAKNTTRSFSYMATSKNTSSRVVSVQRKKADNSVSYVRHHAFIPRFERIGGQWHLIITPTYHFTYDGYLPHSYPDALLSGKKRLETNAALRGQIIMWHRYLTQDQHADGSLLAFSDDAPPSVTLGELPEIELPETVPELAWESKITNSNQSSQNAEASLLDVT